MMLSDVEIALWICVKRTFPEVLKDTKIQRYKIFQNSRNAIANWAATYILKYTA